ncbi:MAG: ATP-binding protein [Cyanobacteria bacterium P01_A01_bin.45]
MPLLFDNYFPKKESRGFADCMQNYLSRLSISSKIRLGYALTLGIALSGTILGILIGQIYEKRSQDILKDVLEENELLAQFKIDLLEAKNLEKELVFHLEKPNLFRKRYKVFLKEISELDDTWESIKKSYDNAEVKETDEETEALQKINIIYKLSIISHFQKSQNIYKNFVDKSLNSSEIINTREQIFQIDNSNFASIFADIIRNIKNAREIIGEELEEVEREIIILSRIRLSIITASMFISTIFAIIITYYTIKNISRPLQAVTKVATQISQESKFNLQVPVTTNDEVGVLAQNFNQMLVRIRELLIEQQISQEQLAFYNHNLELQVQNRTEELQHKNIDLQKTLVELKNAQNQIIQSEKMSSLGQLVAGVAHEINNPVSFIAGNLVHTSEYTNDLLKLIKLYQEVYTHPEDIILLQIEEIDLEYLLEDLPKAIASMKVGAERITEIVKSLRNFSRLDESEYKQANIHEGIDGTLMILSHRLKSNGQRQEIQIIQDYSPLPLINCYPGQLNQVFMNILSNAIDAIEEYEYKRIKEDIALHPSQIKIKTQIVDDSWLKISIQDYAGGIPEKVISRLFDPFFTTKPIGKGTGLGLSISYQIIVEKHAGKLTCNSKLGEGTEFIIELPI